MARRTAPPPLEAELADLLAELLKLAAEPDAELELLTGAEVWTDADAGLARTSEAGARYLYARLADGRTVMLTVEVAR